jgi:single-strand DNA-binding protein
MATDMNSVTLIGRLTRDAELKYTVNGIAVCKFSIAVNRKKKNGDEWVDEASFFDIVLWGRQGEALNQYLQKGKQIGVAGELRQERWKQQDGQKRSRIEVVANNIQLLGGGRDSESNGRSGSYGNNGGGYGGNNMGNTQAPMSNKPSEKSDESYSGNDPRQYEDTGDWFADDIPF